MNMDRNALDWLFSTAPQALAALVGLIFTGVVFVLGIIDRAKEHDPEGEDVFMEMKSDIHRNLRRIFWLAGMVIISDCVLLTLNPIEEGKKFTLAGNFDLYLLLAGVLFVLNVLTLCYSLCFILQVANPNYFSDTVQRLSKDLKKGSVGISDFLMKFREMEKALRVLPLDISLQNQRPLSVNEMIRYLTTTRQLRRNESIRLLELNRLRNLIAHGSDIETVEQKDMDDLKTFTKRFQTEQWR